jgi:hypothetical protein
MRGAKKLRHLLRVNNRLFILSKRAKRAHRRTNKAPLDAWRKKTVPLTQGEQSPVHPE